ncbi:hypothetical protein FGE12_10730 [Aggregicoccus sp. 17bor-14]|uniref:MSCRAMM family protein n=1 Tax=Myxococcaceae TaxID=31 RepID=UPI00129C24F3|nr:MULTISPECIES: carboxypeptidase regulatory-like domain-containing protein [Myxococcaceae]MBF5042864.1 carboxypeptidase regulatory-like domain-containing protein [Simulacricoccus sp. 17bor-14]MRI88631.1 hypothetical protein [Aggregicoccus sp. 17bor-14]
MLHCLLFALLAACAAGAGSAQAQVPQAELRVRAGAALRSGGQQDAGPGLSYAGHTFDDLGLDAAAFVHPRLALRLSLQREAFSLVEGADAVTSGSLVRASLGPALRLGLGPLRAELGAGYELAQLPLFGDSRTPQLARAVRHAALLGARLQLPLPHGLQAELRGALPVTLAAHEAGGGAASASGFSAGAALLVPVAQRGRWSGALVLDAQHVRDAVASGDGSAHSTQRLTRLGLALQVALSEKVAPRSGALRLSVSDARTGLPLRYVPVALTSVGHEQGLRSSDGRGLLTAEGLAPGELWARLEVPGYLPAEARVQVVAGALTRLELLAQPTPYSPPPTGTLRVRVTDATSGEPLAGARVQLGEDALESDGDGTVSAPWLTPGPVAVRVSHSQYRDGEEAVVVVAGSETQLPVALTPLRKRTPALLSGQVRSAGLGRPLLAVLEIPRLGLRTITNAGGVFSVHLPPGTWRVVISAGEHLAQTKLVSVQDGEQAIFNVDLFPAHR